MASDTINDIRNIQLVATQKDDNTAGTLQCVSEADHQSCWDKFCCSLSQIIAFDAIINCVSTTLTKSYDLITILISIADVTTDIWVIYNFKIAKRTTFFTISLIIMILAQLSYAIAFMWRFRVEEKDLTTYTRERKILCLFISILPFTPLMSFVFYICSEFPNNFLMKFLRDNFDVNDSLSDELEDGINPNQAKIIVWVKKKLTKHMGFILEAMIEALPQSIIQLIAIVYYQDTQIINVISICISLLSVSTKAMVFSTAIDFRVFIFNWLSLVCDFFGIFAVVSWYVQ